MEAGDTEKASAPKDEGGNNKKDDEEKESRTVFVGNLPTSFTPKKVKAAFKEYGAVESVRLRSVAVQGMAVDKAGDQVRLCVPAWRRQQFPSRVVPRASAFRGINRCGFSTVRSIFFCSHFFVFSVFLRVFRELRKLVVWFGATALGVLTLCASWSRLGTNNNCSIRVVCCSGSLLCCNGGIILSQQLVRKVCVNRGMVDEEVKSSVNAYVVYKDGASVEKVGCCSLCRDGGGGGGGVPSFAADRILQWIPCRTRSRCRTPNSHATPADWSRVLYVEHTFPSIITMGASKASVASTYCIRRKKGALQLRSVILNDSCLAAAVHPGPSCQRHGRGGQARPRGQGQERRVRPHSLGLPRQPSHGRRGGGGEASSSSSSVYTHSTFLRPYFRFHL